MTLVSSCDRCGRAVDSYIVANSDPPLHLCEPCNDIAKKELHAKRVQYDCAECGTHLDEHDPDPGSPSRLFECPGCGLSYVERVGVPLHRRHEDQPRCVCGKHATYRAVVVPARRVVGKRLPHLTIWDCQFCGRRLQVESEWHQERPFHRMVRVDVIKEPS